MKDFVREYALQLIAIAALGIVLLFTLIERVNNPCWDGASFVCKQARVAECLKSELYTLDQCVILIGGGK